MTTRSARTALAAVVFAVLLAQVLLYPGIDTLVAALGADTTLDASMWFLAAEFGAFVLFAGLWGAASDAAGRRVPFIVAGALGGAAGYALLAGLPQVIDLPFLAVLGLRTLQGAATIGAFSLSITMLMDLEGGHGRNMGAAGIAIGGGTALGAPLGGQLYEVNPFAPLIAACALLIAVGLLASRVTDRAPGESRGRLGAVRETIRDTPAILVPCAFGFVDRLTAGFFALVGTLYFREVFALSPGSTGLMLALFFAPFALFQYPFGVLSDRIGRTIPVLAGSTLYGLVVIGVGLAPTVALAGAAMVAVGVIGALMAPATMALVTDLAADDQRGVAMAAFNAVGSLGFLAGVLVGGTVADEYGYFAAFLTVGGLEVAVATLAVPAFLRLGIPGVATRARES
ncbi:MFS transporter [Halorientalis pallida]|uniref:MFS transporter n=1 Tax=Halorientalis pallida TaxID=2479928 RepID=UPI003C6FCEFB